MEDSKSAEYDGKTHHPPLVRVVGNPQYNDEKNGQIPQQLEKEVPSHPAVEIILDTQNTKPLLL